MNFVLEKSGVVFKTNMATTPKVVKKQILQDFHAILRNNSVMRKCCLLLLIGGSKKEEGEEINHAACQIEFQPFSRSYSQLTFFNFFFWKKWDGKKKLANSQQISKLPFFLNFHTCTMYICSLYVFQHKLLVMGLLIVIFRV